MSNPKLKPLRLALWFGLSTGAVSAGMTHAAEIDTGNPDLSARWDNTVRYNLGVRAESRDSALARNASYDESDAKFDRGDVVTNRVDLMSELEVAYKQYHGVRVSGAAWYDQAYDDTDVKTADGNVYYPGAVPGPSTPSYRGGQYSGFTKRYHRGVSGELLDAFAFTRFDLGEIPVSVRAGRHTVYWGNGLLIAGHAISYSQAPLDGRKAVSNPGTETREIFLPLTQISTQAQITDKLSVAAQYFLEWDTTRAPEGGTYLASADVALQGPNQLPLLSGVTRPLVDPLKPKNSGSWGVMGTYSLDWLHSDVSLYYREFADYNPWGLQVAPTFARYVYPKDIKLYGLGFSAGPLLGGGSLGVDLSYRQNTSLVSSNISTVDNEGARGDTMAHGGQRPVVAATHRVFRHRQPDRRDRVQPCATGDRARGAVQGRRVRRVPVRAGQTLRLRDQKLCRHGGQFYPPMAGGVSRLEYLGPDECGLRGVRQCRHRRWQRRQIHLEGGHQGYLRRAL